jgi:hypothetical protein
MRKRTYNEALVDALLKKFESEEFQREWEARQRLPNPDGGQARGLPVIAPGVSGATPGSRPHCDADLSPVEKRARIEEALRRLRRERGEEEAPRTLTKREIAAIVKTIRRNLDETVEFGDEWVNLMLTYTGRHPDPKVPKGHPDLPADWNERLKDALLWEWLGKTLDLMSAKELRVIRDEIIEDEIRKHPKLSNRELATLLDNIISHDTINRVRRKMNAVTEIKQHVDERFDRLERLESMRAETVDRVRQTVEELASRFPADPQIQRAAEDLLAD